MPLTRRELIKGGSLLAVATVLTACEKAVAVATWTPTEAVENISVQFSTSLRKYYLPILQEAVEINFPQYGLISSGAVFEEFSSAEEWVSSGGGSIADNSNAGEFRTGTQSIKQTSAMGADGEMGKAISQVFGSAPMLRVVFYLHNLVSQLVLIKFSLGSTSSLSKNFTFTFSTLLLQPGWNTYDIYPEAAWANTGGEDWGNTMVKMRLSVKPQSGQQVSVSWDQMSINPILKPAIAMTFDDCSETVYTVVLPYLRSKGKRATFFVIPTHFGNKDELTAAQCREFYANGWDIGWHGDYRLTDMTEAGCETELNKNKSLLDAIGVSRATMHVAYPYGSVNETVDTAMANVGMLTGRLTGKDRYFTGRDVKYREPTIMELASSILTLAEAEAKIDLVAAGRMGIIYAHTFSDPPGTEGWTPTDFYALVDYIISKGIPFLTISQFYALQFGPVTIPG